MAPLRDTIWPQRLSKRRFRVIRFLDARATDSLHAGCVLLDGLQRERGTRRSFIYRLRKRQNKQEYSTLHSMPDGALLVVTKRVYSPSKSGLCGASRPGTPRNRVRTSWILTWGQMMNHSDRAIQKDRWDRNDQLLMDSAGNYLVVRLSQNADTWNQNPGESAKPPLSVLNIIDLHGFKLLSRVVVTDPLLAAGNMGFSPRGAFVVSGLQEHRSATIGGKVTNTGQYAVEILTLPGLKPEPVCRLYHYQQTLSRRERFDAGRKGMWAQTRSAWFLLVRRCA